ncbi:MAG: hypothetical protein V7646_2071 [Pseudonocardia sp.]
MVLAICLATGFTPLLDQAVLNVAVPALRTDLAADQAQVQVQVQWILAAHSLSFEPGAGAGRAARGRARRGREW